MPEVYKKSTGEVALDELISDVKTRETAAAKRAIWYTAVPVMIGILFVGISWATVSRLRKTAANLNSQIQSAAEELARRKEELKEAEAKKKEVEDSLTVATTTLTDIKRNPKDAQEKAKQALQIVGSRAPLPSLAPPSISPAQISTPTPERPAVVGDPINRSPSQVDQKAVILEKPRANYTEDARKNQIQGTVRLQIVLDASGKVTKITPLTKLGHGLDEQAILAASRIRFKPALKDGQPVSQTRIVEYTFNLY